MGEKKRRFWTAAIALLVVVAPLGTVVAQDGGGASTPEAESTPTPEAESTATTEASGETIDVTVDAAETAQRGETVAFAASSAGANGSVDYEWTFGETGFASGETFERTFVDAGTHEVTVTAEDDAGNVASETVTVDVGEEFGDVPVLASGDSVGPTEDNIAYAVDVAAGQSIGVVFDSADNREVQVYGPGGEVVDRERGVNAPDTTMTGVTADRAGRYHVTFAHGMIGASTVYVRDSDEDEPNDARAAATELDHDASIEARLTERDTVDWYAVRTGEGQIDASVRLDAIAANQGDLAVQVFDSDGQPIGDAPEGSYLESRTRANGADATYRAAVRAQVDAPGTYYVRIAEPPVEEGDDERGFEGIDGFSDYTLSIDAPEPTTGDGGAGTAPDDGESDVGDDGGGDGGEETADHGDVDEGATESLDVNLGPDRTASVGETVEFAANASGASGDATYRWTVARNGTPVDHAEGESLSHAFNASDDYTVTVTAEDGEATATDEVAVTVDRSFAAVPTLESGESITGQGSQAFAVDAAAGQAIGVAAESGTGGTATLYGPDGQRLSTRSLHSDSELFGAAANRTGTHHLTLATDGFPDATVHVREPDDTESDDNASAAAALDADGNATATLTGVDRVDWYAVEAGAGDLEVSLELTVDAVNQDDVSVAVFDPDGRPIGEVNPNETGETNRTFANGVDGRVSATQRARIQKPGTYHVRVSGPRDDRREPDHVAGFVEYELAVSAPTAPTEDTAASDRDGTGPTAGSGDSAETDRALRGSVGDRAVEDTPTDAADDRPRGPVVANRTDPVGGATAPDLAGPLGTGSAGDDAAASSDDGTTDAERPAAVAPLCDDCGPPTDPDGDGVYEDVDGDGNADSGDVLVLLTHLSAAGERGGGTAFDVDGDGDVGTGDAAALFWAIS